MAYQYGFLEAFPTYDTIDAAFMMQIFDIRKIHGLFGCSKRRAKYAADDIPRPPMPRCARLEMPPSLPSRHARRPVAPASLGHKSFHTTGMIRRPLKATPGQYIDIYLLVYRRGGAILLLATYAINIDATYF